MQDLTTEFETGSPSVLYVAGEIDIATAEQLRAALERALATGAAFIVDMAGVAFIDATGLRVILQAAAALDGAGPLTLANAPLVARLLQLAGQSARPSIEIREPG